ncbi:MAG: hypothetical protein QF704_08145 [Anaerolineales bacterium]|jgi:hypothetical protein|nr:hypothetical protein [Anaerolineales bacterium]
MAGLNAKVRLNMIGGVDFAVEVVNEGIVVISLDNDIESDRLLNITN